MSGNYGTNTSVCYLGKCDLFAKQNGRASNANEVTMEVLQVQLDAFHRDLAKQPHLILTGKAGWILPRQK